MPVGSLITDQVQKFENAHKLAPCGESAVSVSGKGHTPSAALNGGRRGVFVLGGRRGDRCFTRSRAGLRGHRGHELFGLQASGFWWFWQVLTAGGASGGWGGGRRPRGVGGRPEHGWIPSPECSVSVGNEESHLQSCFWDKLNQV